VHTTPDARFALVCLLMLTGTVTLARVGEARFAAARTQQSATPAAAAKRARLDAKRGADTARASGEGDALRDGRTLDLARATAVELELLPGVGPRLAAEIVRVRESDHGFRALGDLRRVRGIGDKTFAKIAPWLHLGAMPVPPRHDAGGP